MALTFAADLVPGLVLIPVVLVDGVPVILTPAGVHPTTVTGSVPSSWWPGAGSLTETLPSGATLDPVCDWLDTSAAWTVSERASLVECDIDVPALSVQLYDPDGSATAALSGHAARLGTLLTAEATAAATSLTVASTSPASAQEIAHLGREAVTFTGTAAGPPRLTGATRGRYGSTARMHPSPDVRRPVVTFGRWPRYWHGRGCKVFLARLDGTTLSAVTLWYQGVIGAGVELVDGLTRWHLPVDHVTSSLRREYTPPTLDLYGIAHYAGGLEQISNPDVTPLSVQWLSVAYYLASDSASPHGGGWHPSWADFLGAFRAQIYTLSGAPPEVLQVQEITSGVLTVTASGGVETDDLRIYAAWRDPHFAGGYGSAQTFSLGALPEACIWLDGWCKVPASVDFAKIPSTLTYAASEGGYDGLATYALSASTDAVEDYAAAIVERDAVNQRVRLTPLWAWDFNLRGRGATGTGTPQTSLCTSRTTASVIVSAYGDRWDVALRAAGAAIDALQGADGTFEQAIDWPGIAAVLARYPSPLAGARSYKLEGEDTLLGMIVRECRLGGFVPVMRGGKVSIARMDDVASTEPYDATITADDLDTSAEVEITDSPDGLTSTVAFQLGEDGDEIRWTDTTLVDEFGAGATVEVPLDPSIFPVPILPADLAARLRDVAWTILGTTAHPYRVVKLPCGPHKGDVEAGDVVRLTHHAVPAFDGTRSVASLPCRVQEVERVFFGGRALHSVTVRLPAGTPTGYAPEALVAAGGIATDTPSAGQTTLTLDASSGWGGEGFADGAGTDGGASWFAVGDKVVVSELDSRTPTVEGAFEVLSVSGADVVIDGNPSVALVAASAAAYKVLLRYDDYTSATRASPAPAQHDFAYISDGTDLGASDAPDRYSA